MYFNLVRAGVVCLCAVLAVRCGLNTGESAPRQDPPSFSGKGYSCVGQIPQTIERYAADELDQNQISDFVHCLEKAFVSFGQLTRGNDREAYAPDEIRRFLQTYFFRERSISAGMSREFMVIKQILVGGRDDQVTRSELNELITLLEDVRIQAIRLKPHIRFLNPRLVEQQNPAEVGEKLAVARDALFETIQVLGARLRRFGQDYTFDNMESFMTEFRGFVRWEEYFGEAHSVKSWVNFFKVFRVTTTNPESPEIIRAVDWPQFLTRLARWYVTYLEYRAGVRNQPLLYGPGLKNVMHVAREIFDLTEDAVNRQEKGTLNTKQIEALVAAVQGLDWIPARIRPGSVDRVLHALLGRVFGDEVNAEGLSSPQLKLMKIEFFRWAAVQQKLNENFHSEALKREIHLPNRVPNLHPGSFLPADVRTQLSGLGQSDWERFLQIKKLARPLFNENLDRVTLVSDGEMPLFKLSHEFNNLSMMNLFRSLVGIMFRGYSVEANRRMDWEAGIKSEELQSFYEDIRDLAVDLRLADERVRNTGVRAFIEGNLFTYAADGVPADGDKARLSFVESMELVAFLYSGQKTAKDIFSQLKQDCPTGGGFDQNGEPLVARACALAAMNALITRYSVNMPGMTAYLRQAPHADRDLVVKNLMESAFSPTSSKVQWIEYNEISIMAVVLHYMEAVLTRFDADGNGVLTNEEVPAAVPVFIGFFQKFARDRLQWNLSSFEAEGAFRYVLIYKQVPSWWNMVSIYWLPNDLRWELNFVGYPVKIDLNQRIYLDRAGLSSVFRAIVAKIFDTAPGKQ